MDITIERKGLFAEAKILNSVKAEKGAERLLHKIESEEMTMEVLANASQEFSGEREERDYVSYCQFLESVNGKKVIQMLEDEDAGKFIKLW